MKLSVKRSEVKSTIPLASLAEADRAGEDSLGLLAEDGPESKPLSAIFPCRFWVKAYTSAHDWIIPLSECVNMLGISQLFTIRKYNFLQVFHRFS